MTAWLIKGRPPCCICGAAPATRARRCMTCYQYRRRNGIDRPDELVVAHGRRLLQRVLEREARR